MRFWASLVLSMAGMCAHAGAQASSDGSADLLFAKSDPGGALRKSALELKRNPHDLNAHFVRMEAARMELRNREELHSAIGVLRAANGTDPRARLAAERIRELAANTPQFRAVLPQIADLLRTDAPYAIELSDAVLTAQADGTTLPGRIRLARRITKWQVAGPFGQFANIDFDRVWPAEENELRSSRYDYRIREDVEVDSGEIELPEYFPRSGIYFAAAQLSITKAAKYRLTVEGDGTYEVRLDGNSLLLHDARFTRQRETTKIDVQMEVEKHRIFVKLQAAALPLRIWIEPLRDSNALPLRVPVKEMDYLQSATAVLDGNPKPALTLKDQNSLTNLLKAEALAQMGDDQQARELFLAASTSDARNLLAVYKLAEQAFGDEQYEEATTQLGRVLKGAPAYPQAQELKFQLAEHFNWRTEQEAALNLRLRLHPSCNTLADAAKFYDGSNQADRTRRYEAALATCSPKPYQYWELLSLHGKHKEASANIGEYLVRRPSNRRALTIAIREAILDNDLAAANQYAKLLRALSPNWNRAALIVIRPESILDSPSTYSAANGFYKPFVRDPLPMLRDREGQLPDSRILINDRVVKLDANGAWIYQHTVTQVLNKKGIAQLGEVELPRAVDLLELRTLKPGGTFVEAELGNNRNTVSMPSLAEGDAIEIAYLQHISTEVLTSSPETLDFSFASALAPTRSSRLTLIRENVPEPLFWRSSEVRCIHSEPTSDIGTTVWEVSNAPAILDEPAAPQYERRPRLLWLAMDRAQPIDRNAKIQDELISATRVTFRIRELAAELQSSSEFGPVAAYRYVMTNVEEEQQGWRDANITSADESLKEGQGSRAATLIALLSAMGFKADLALTSERGKHEVGDGCPGWRCYVHPLVSVQIAASRQLLLDPELENVATGALSPEVEGEQGFLISRSPVRKKESFVVPRSTDQLSAATANLRIDEEGAISGEIHIRFGSFRSGQMRQLLRDVSGDDRQDFLQQVADRIMPAVNQVSATITNEEDFEKPLELQLDLRASKYGRLNRSELQLEQIIPALGLARAYATLSERQQPVLLETPLVESSEFVIHLPAGLEVVRVPNAVDIKSGFGEYHTEFKIKGTELKIIRTFHIPAQVVDTSEYRDFSDFALQIDGAERELIQLRRMDLAQVPTTPSLAQSPQPLH